MTRLWPNHLTSVADWLHLFESIICPENTIRFPATQSPVGTFVWVSSIANGHWDHVSHSLPATWTRYIYAFQERSRETGLFCIWETESFWRGFTPPTRQLCGHARFVTRPAVPRSKEELIKYIFYQCVSWCIAVVAEAVGVGKMLWILICDSAFCGSFVFEACKLPAGCTKKQTASRASPLDIIWVNEMCICYIVKSSSYSAKLQGADWSCVSFPRKKNANFMGFNLPRSSCTCDLGVQHPDQSSSLQCRMVLSD